MAVGQIEGRIEKVSGHLVVASGMAGCACMTLLESVTRGYWRDHRNFEGHGIDQVYEENLGVGPGEKDRPGCLSVELGPDQAVFSTASRGRTYTRTGRKLHERGWKCPPG